MSSQGDTGATAPSPSLDAAALATAFARAHFHLDAGSERIEAQVGQPCPDVERLASADAYGYVTAWNPYAEACDASTNMHADDKLAARLQALGVDHRRTWSEDAQGAHREAGWLVAGLFADRIDALGREFGQAGVLAWLSGEPVRLRMLMARPADAAEVECVDWIE